MAVYISKKTTITFFIVVFFIFIDRLFKTLALKGFLDNPINIIGDLFSLHFAKNYFIAFSLPLSGVVLNFIIGTIILILMFWWVRLVFPISKLDINKNNSLLISPLTILILGAILNFTDRLRFGYVIDYFDLKYFTVFNVADIFICFSIFYLIIFFYNPAKKGGENETTKNGS